jgi:hypothetical protein
MTVHLKEFCIGDSMIKTLNNKKYLAVLLSAVMLLGACSNEVTDFSLKEAVTETTNDTGNVSYEESTKAIKQDVTGSFPAFYNTQIGKCTFSIDKIDSPEEITLYSGTACNTNADYLGLAKELLKGEAYNTVEETGELYVIESAEGIEKLDKATRCRYGARTVLLVCGDKEKAYVKDDFPIYGMDASIVATHMMLEATNVGVDNIWIEMFKSDVLREEFDIPDNLVPVSLLPLGYKAKLCPPSPLHSIRKKLKDLVEYK